MKLLHSFFIVMLMLTGFIGQGQTTGDTLIYQAFNYNSTTRDTVINLPNNLNLTFEKVIMLYSMRCKDGLISTSSNRNRGCGEWDYSNNTYITDSAHIDSLSAIQAKYAVSGWSGTAFPYTTQPTYRRHQVVQPKATVTSTNSEDTAIIGSGLIGLPMPVSSAATAGKLQSLYTQTELLAAGLSAGNITAMAFYLNSAPQLTKMLRVRIKATSDTMLNPGAPHLSGFTEVYYHTTTFTSGINRLQFYAPFAWNGTSNLIVEVSFTNKTVNQPMVFQGDSLGPNATVGSFDQAVFDFTGTNFIESDTYSGISGSAPRTIEAWIKTTGTTQDIMYWGANSSGQKYRFWINGAGKLRLEVNGGYIEGTTLVNDGQWHHVAMVQSGTNTNQIAFFVDGVSESISSVGNLAINTNTAVPVQIGKSVHNTNFNGSIGEVRLWSTALSQTTIANWMTRRVEANHPHYSALELYYPLTTNTAAVINDESGKNRHDIVKNGANWMQNYGVDMFKFCISD